MSYGSGITALEWFAAMAPPCPEQFQAAREAQFPAEPEPPAGLSEKAIAAVRVAMMKYGQQVPDDWALQLDGPAQLEPATHYLDLLQGHRVLCRAIADAVALQKEVDWRWHWAAMMADAGNALAVRIGKESHRDQAAAGEATTAEPEAVAGEQPARAATG